MANIKKISKGVKKLLSLLFSKRYIEEADSYSKLVDLILRMCLFYILPLLFKPIRAITKPVIWFFTSCYFEKHSWLIAVLLTFPFILPYAAILGIFCWPIILSYSYSRNYFNSVLNIGIGLFIGNVYICIICQITSILFVGILLFSIIFILVGIKIELNSTKNTKQKIELKTGNNALLVFLWELMLSYVLPWHLTAMGFVIVLFVPFAIGSVATLFKIRSKLHKQNKVFDLTVLILLCICLSLLDCQYVNLLEGRYIL